MHAHARTHMHTHTPQGWSESTAGNCNQLEQTTIVPCPAGLNYATAAKNVNNVEQFGGGGGEVEQFEVRKVEASPAPVPIRWKMFVFKLSCMYDQCMNSYESEG